MNEKRTDEAAVSVKNLSFGYGSVPVLSDVSLQIDRGDFLGIIGPNGSGKTTLLKLMLGIYKSRAGSIELFGRSIERFSDWSSIGYVPQKAANVEESFPATVKEVVGMGLLSKKKFPKSLNKEDQKHVAEALATVGMTQYAEKRIGELSGGQQQRVYIARAIVSKPGILFLDEPTTGVDQESQKKFYELLSDLNTRGITIVLVTHDIGRITRYVTKIASLNQRLEFYGNHAGFCEWDAEHHHRSPEEHSICLHGGSK